MHPIVKTLFELLTQGKIKEFFIVLFNQYFPYGSFFWLLGLIIFIISHIKTKNLAFASALLGVYLVVLGNSGLITNVYSMQMMKWFGLILGVIAGWYLYRALKG